MRRLHVRAALRALPVFAALCLAGCLSNSPGSSSTASVVVEHVPPQRIQPEIVRVFSGEQYEVLKDEGSPLVFERAATQRDKVLFGTFMTDTMKIRVEVTTDPYRSDSTLVCANAYVVLDGDVDRQIGMVGSGHYRGLLKQAKASILSSDPK